MKWVKKLDPISGALFFLVLYIIFMLLMLPGALLTICAGFINGILVGGLLSWSGAFMGSLVCFLVGRKLLRSTVQRWTSRYPLLEATVNVIGSSEGWKMVFLLRLSPITPYSLLSYLLATTKIDLITFLSATGTGVIPGVILYCYLGTAARSFADIISGPNKQDPQASVRAWVACISLLLTVFVVVLLSLIATKAIKSELQRKKIVTSAEATTISKNTELNM
jgi:uncharacterized membrane protein YdjX (TVP38/TMEM64 family)